MTESDFTVDGVAYRCRRLSAARQFEILQRITPVLPTLIGTDAGLRLGKLDAASLMLLLAPLQDAPDEITDAVFSDVRSAVERVDDDLVGDLPLSSLMTLTGEVVRQNFGSMRAMLRPVFTPCPTGEHDKGFGELGPVEMPDGQDWLYAPMQAGHCRYSELHDGTLRIEDVQRMNDLITVKGENEARLRLAAER